MPSLFLAEMGTMAANQNGVWYEYIKRLQMGYTEKNAFRCETWTDGITEIKEGAFSECKNLALDSLPGSLVSIEHSAFYSCYGLQFNDNFFGNKLVNIGESAFSMRSGKDIIDR